MALEEFKEVIKFAKQEPDRITLLLGNHMLHYCGLSADNCRMDFNNAREIYSLLSENKELFQHAFKWGNTLFTHAGVTKGWLEYNNIPEDPDKISTILNSNITFTDEFLENPMYLGCLKDPISQISICRGGIHNFGSPAWADLMEMYANSAFKDSLIQIIGHTQLKTDGYVFNKDNFYCCDSREVFIWDGETLKVFE